MRLRLLSDEVRSVTDFVDCQRNELDAEDWMAIRTTSSALAKAILEFEVDIGCVRGAAETVGCR